LKLAWVFDRFFFQNGGLRWVLEGTDQKKIQGQIGRPDMPFARAINYVVAYNLAKGSLSNLRAEAWNIIQRLFRSAKKNRKSNFT
jgi:hypothetical protein